MRTSVLMERIRAECPGFAAVEHALSSSADMAFPAAMVTPSKCEAAAEGTVGLGIHSQLVTQTFSIFILQTRTQDGVVGYGKADGLDDLIDELRAALVGWQPDTEEEPLQLVGGLLDRFHTGTVCWREDYSIQTELRLTR